MNKITLLLLGFTIEICACNYGANNSTTQSNDNSNLIDPAAKGNGVWNYSVATDYYYGMKQESPSLWYDLTQQYDTSSIQFVFPQFPTLSVASSGVFDPDAAGAFSTTCPTSTNHKAPSTEMFNYYALPQLNSYIVNGVDAYLGNCAAGEDITVYYANFISHVVPVIDVSQEFNAALSTAGDTTVLSIADHVAAIINNDQHTYGVSFDNEPAINLLGADSGEPTAKGYRIERMFYGEIALQLAKQKKYLFLFDANATGIILYTNGYNGSALNNIVLQQYLYDLDTTNPATPAGPVSLENYTTLVDKQAKNDLSPANSTQPPLRFVLPASATSTMWDYAQGYNMVSSKSTYTNQTILNNPAPCLITPATTIGTIDNGTLGLFLCSVDGSCPSSSSNPNIAAFLNNSNCINYTNPTKLLAYFDASLQSVKRAGVSNPRYLGSDLYTWNIQAFPEINASKGYFNQYGESNLYQLNTQVFPTEITPDIWAAFLLWNQSLF